MSDTSSDSSSDELMVRPGDLDEDRTAAPVPAAPARAQSSRAQEIIEAARLRQQGQGEKARMQPAAEKPRMQAAPADTGKPRMQAAEPAQERQVFDILMTAGLNIGGGKAAPPPPPPTSSAAAPQRPSWHPGPLGPGSNAAADAQRPAGGKAGDRRGSGAKGGKGGGKHGGYTDQFASSPIGLEGGVRGPGAAQTPMGMMNYAQAQAHMAHGSPMTPMPDQTGTPQTPQPPQQQQQQQQQQQFKGRCTFAPYVSREEAIAGVMNGKYLKGVFNCNKSYGSTLAFVRNPTVWSGMDIALEGKEHRNRALEKDEVIIELLPPSEWKEKTGNNLPPKGTGEQLDVRKVQIRSREEDALLPKEERSKLPDQRPICRALQVLKRAKKEEEDPLENVNLPKPDLPRDKLPTARVVHIWKKCHNPKHVARAMKAPAGQEGRRRQWYRFVPYDGKYPHCDVHVSSLNEKVIAAPDQHLLYLQFREWTQDRQLPQADCVRVLGNADQVEVETRAILIENNTDYDDTFSEACMAVIPAEVPVDEELRKDPMRRDCRLNSKHPRFVVSIDPATARDLDDALSCEPLGNGHWRVGVHIADVSAFVPFGSELDEEARKRATSVYMVQRVIPMLPRKLCEEHCSLNQHGDKLAFTVEWTMDAKGNITKEWMGQTVIRNQCKMAYEHAQAIIDGTFVPEMLDLSHLPQSRHAWTIERIKEGVHGLWGIAKHIREARHARGALSLNQGRMAFDFEDFNSGMAPKGWHLHTTAEANWLVEEFMVMANARVTEKCVEFCPDVSLARYHAPPDKERFESLLKALKEKGLKMNVGSGKALSDSLGALRDHKQVDVIKALTIRCMMLAKYCCTNESKDHSLSHFALNLELYTHFTSPIRRYADLVVHRTLKCALEIEALYKEKLRQGYRDEDVMIRPSDIRSGELLLPEADVMEISNHCNNRKEEARKAGDQSLVLFYALYLQSRYQMWKEDGKTEYKERHGVTLVKVQEKSFNIYVDDLNIDKELYHDNGSGDQRWVGGNRKNGKKGLMAIQWEDGLWEECMVLSTWQALISYDPKAKGLDFKVELLPPAREELVPESVVAITLPG
eukprot:TRINITY_DN5681_c0_g2_i1.p1 TRINITY_DN5681_c0_g2~~TRINITY_DN5681_c0_g2_i1.p1  ORF type:complete len:1086 (+),score=411.79 TRINITY_DN5681_c0_g2_i1:110-3367(+)